MTSSLISNDLVPVAVNVDDLTLQVIFNGGLQLSTPVSRFPRLSQATPSQRKNWRLIGRGDGIHWPEVDEDISIQSLLRLPKRTSSSRFEEVPALIGDLLKTTQRLNTLFQGRPFTPDGHLVGSIGEVIAEYIYDLKLKPSSTPQVDALTHDGRSVQIKLTGAKGKSFGLRWSSQLKTTHADLLIALKLNEDGFTEIYNGPFPKDLLEGRSDTSNGQISVPISKLSARNPSLLPAKNSYASINRWFTPNLSDVA
jgi:hypothetical protein